MFKPMAWTVVFALAGSLLLTVTLTPVLASLFLRKTGHEHEPRFVGTAPRVLPARARRLPRAPRCSCSSAGLLVVVAGGLLATRLGGEFIPRLDEGDLSISRDPPVVGGDLRGGGEHRPDRARPHALPGGHHRGQPLGQPGAGHGRHGHRARRRVRDAEAPVRVDDRPDQGRAGREDERGARRVRARGRLLVHPADRDALQRADRRGPLRRRHQALRRRPRHPAREGRGDRARRGARPGRRGREAGADEPACRWSGSSVDRDRCARYGISVGDVLDTVEAARAGKVVGTVFEGQRRFSLAVRLERRDGPHPRRARRTSPSRRPRARASRWASSPRSRSTPGPRRSAARRSGAGSWSRRTCAVATWRRSWPRPRSASPARCSSPAATTSTGAGSSRTCRRPRDRLLVVVPLALAPHLRDAVLHLRLR